MLLGDLGLCSPPSSLVLDTWFLSPCYGAVSPTMLLGFLSWHQAHFSAANIAQIFFALFSPSCYLIIAALFLLGFLYGSYLSSGFLYISVGLTSIKFWCHSSELLLPVFHNLLVSFCSCQCLSACLTQLNSSQTYPSIKWRALSWSGSQGCVKKAMKMFKSTTWNENLFALSLPQNLRAEPICLNPHDVLHAQLCDLLPKYSSVLKSGATNCFTHDLLKNLFNSHHSSWTLHWYFRLLFPKTGNSNTSIYW